ncbi:hypothetical protein MRX96_005752 [Rhipicephalus microplus]
MGQIVVVVTWRIDVGGTKARLKARAEGNVNLVEGSSVYIRHREAFPWKNLAKLAAAVLYHVYLAVGVALRWSSCSDFSHDVKFPVVMTEIVYSLGLVNAVAALMGRFDMSSIRCFNSDAIRRSCESRSS